MRSGGSDGRVSWGGSPLTEEQAHGIIGLGSKLVGSLPAQFLSLALVNLVIVGGLFWHLDSQLAARERVLAQLVSACIEARR